MLEIFISIHKDHRDILYIREYVGNTNGSFQFPIHQRPAMHHQWRISILQ